MLSEGIQKRHVTYNNRVIADKISSFCPYWTLVEPMLHASNRDSFFLAADPQVAAEVVFGKFPTSIRTLNVLHYFPARRVHLKLLTLQRNIFSYRKMSSSKRDFSPALGIDRLDSLYGRSGKSPQNLEPQALCQSKVHGDLPNFLLLFLSRAANGNHHGFTENQKSIGIAKIISIHLSSNFSVATVVHPPL